MLARLVAHDLRAQPKLVLGLATGRTMESVYDRLARMHRESGLNFAGARTFNLDEYVGLPASDPHSYRHYMQERLFRHVNVDLRNTHLPRGDAAGMLKQFRKNYDFFDAPVGMILCVERRMGNGQWIDCGIFLDQLMLLAREKGLHTCPQAAFSRYQHVVRRELNIPDDQVVICGLALGYADPDAVPNCLITERAPIEDFTTWHGE